jgi:hypothetical protein
MIIFLPAIEVEVNVSLIHVNRTFDAETFIVFSLVASTAPRCLRAAGNAHSTEAVRKGAVHGPRALVGAHEGVSTITARVLICIGLWLIVDVAGLNWGGDICLAGP